jgi:hypothetical protein
MSTSQRNFGSIISAVGTLLALLAFLFLPYITTAQVSGTDIQLTTSTALQLALEGNKIFWLEGLLTGILIAGIGWQILRSRTARDLRIPYTTILLIVLSSLILLVLFKLYSSSSPTLISHAFTRSFADYSPTFTCASDRSSIGSANSSGALSTTIVATCTEAALSFDYGPGFWLYIVGMILVIVGSLVQTSLSLQSHPAIPLAE